MTMRGWAVPPWARGVRCPSSASSSLHNPSTQPWKSGFRKRRMRRGKTTTGDEKSRRRGSRLDGDGPRRGGGKAVNCDGHTTWRTALDSGPAAWFPSHSFNHPHRGTLVRVSSTFSLAALNYQFFFSCRRLRSTMSEPSFQPRRLSGDVGLGSKVLVNVGVFMGRACRAWKKGPRRRQAGLMKAVGAACSARW